MIDFLSGVFAEVHARLFESAVQPALAAMGLLAHSEDAFDFTEWFLIGVIEVCILAAILIPIERRWPAERLPEGEAGDSARIDITYTLLHRLGAFAVFAFAVLQPVILDLKDALRTWGVPSIQLDAALGLTYAPFAAALVYLLVMDFADYWIHRMQHRLRWWWALHALHHSQRRMTLWTDNRNHLLDDLIRDALLASLALLVGMAPAQFLGIVVITRVWQSVEHANIGLAFPSWLCRIVVSPGFHRLHHAVGVGHEGRAGGVNFAVLFPVWDWIFGTADWSADRRFARGEKPEPTGIRDQAQGVNYGRSLLQQQWIGLLNLLSALGLRVRRSD